MLVALILYHAKKTCDSPWYISISLWHFLNFVKKLKITYAALSGSSRLGRAIKDFLRRLSFRFFLLKRLRTVFTKSRASSPDVLWRREREIIIMHILVVKKVMRHINEKGETVRDLQKDLIIHIDRSGMHCYLNQMGDGVLASISRLRRETETKTEKEWERSREKRKTQREQGNR